MGGTPVGLTARDIAQYLLRVQGPEFYASQAFATLSSPIVNTPVPLNRPCYGLLLEWRGRVVIGVANYTAVAAEAPQTIIERIKIFGNHRRFGSVTLYELRGATSFAWPRLFQQRGSSLYINTTRQAELSVPLAQAGATFGNTGTYDISAWYYIPFVPMSIPGPQEIGYLAYGEDWGNTMQVQLFFGDLSSFGTPGGTTTVTFSAFGSGAGTPVVNLHFLPTILGALRGSIQGATVMRTFKPVSTVLQSAGTAAQLALLNKGNKTSRVIVKNGVILTGTSSGVNVFASLNDTNITRLILQVDKRPVRNPIDYNSPKEYYGLRANSIAPQGYNGFDFLDSDNVLTAYRSDLLAGGAIYEVNADTPGLANAQGEVIQEEIVGDPVSVG
jgi:hypothetical protein